MSEEFRCPDFSKNDLELRFENNVICIYGTEEGLRALQGYCQDLIEHPQQGHIHLEYKDILTKESQIGAIAIFDKNQVLPKENKLLNFINRLLMKEM
ncbi:MAG: hypothetical protein WC955_07390 [Elusimicrobiota bacterium]